MQYRCLPALGAVLLLATLTSSMPATFATTPTDGTLSLTHAKQFPRPRARPWSSPATLSSTPSFTIENDRFILDGKPFQIISGAIHYFRVHPDLWLDRLARCKALGLNTVEVYIPWNYHEPSIGEYSWSGAADFDLFISLAEDLGLMVLVRAGPYICAEWDFGGLPAWLASSAVAGGGGQMKIRSSDPFYLAHVDRWWRVLLPRLAPRMRAAGGPVLMVQIENEFGFCLGGNDDAYLQHLAGLAREILGKEATLFTTDSPHAVTGGTLKDDTVFTAVDFGPGWFSPEEYFATQKTMNPPGKSPPMDSEFYTGWLSHWGEGMANTSSVLTAIDADILLRWANGTGSLNLYMAHGGTNFGFWAGANVENDGRYEPHITSYDYDGPISESGQYNQPGIGGDGSKYHLMREVFENFTGIEPPEIPDEPIIREYGKVKLHAVDSIMAAAPAAPIISDLPLPMEEYGQSQGIIIYRTMITLSDYSLRTTEMNENDGSEAVLNFVVPPSDYTTVLLDGKVQGKLIRGGPANLTLSSYSSLLRDGKKGHATLEIMVEAMGRRNFGCENGGWDTKGIQSTDIRLNGKFTNPKFIYLLIYIHVGRGLRFCLATFLKDVFGSALYGVLLQRYYEESMDFVCSKIDQKPLKNPPKLPFFSKRCINPSNFWFFLRFSKSGSVLSCCQLS